MAALAEFERDLLQERVRSGIAAAKKRGVRFGRQHGYRPTASRYLTKVLKFVGESVLSGDQSPAGHQQKYGAGYRQT
jgi:DNA invertase Pin-like site-specific DNA recombinase